MSREITYNLPGYGFAKCFLFDNAINIFDVLDASGIIEKTKKICQLGTMKYVYPGAHHTRYEYIFTQLLLISNIVITKESRNIEISLSSELKEFENLGFSISGGDVMQCLALLSNAGHMYDTFTSSKILMRILKESRSRKTVFYEVYKRNLPSELYKSFDRLLDQGNYYKLHQYNMIHILSGLANKKQNLVICKLGLEVLKRLIEPKLICNEATERIFYLYKKIRKIAYLSVDMVYTPASFGANLSRMIYSISTYVDDLFNEDSTLNKSLVQLEDMIHTQIYDSAMCILNTTRIEQRKYDEYNEVVEEIKNIYDIRQLIREEKEPYSLLKCDKQTDIIKSLLPRTELLLSGINANETMNRYFDFDDKIIKYISLNRIAFGTQPSQDLNKIYSAFGLLSLKTICQDTQTVIKTVLDNNLYAMNERIELVKCAIKSVYRFNDFFFNFTAPAGYDLNDCVIIANGCKNAAKQIRNRFNKENVSNANQLHEILSCATVLEATKYSGKVIVFIGGIKASKYNEAKKQDELDGFIYFPTRPTKKTFAIIVEGKNYSLGGNEAEKQLMDTVPLLADNLNYTIKKLKKCAYMELSLK